ncbi:hypothetical protein [Kibdelosporangium philippinense]|uniref:hypothetical protein n=1 Tax=Kibdelosporangium philippinense TaxID=211113 RepID=UPI00361C5F1A
MACLVRVARFIRRIWIPLAKIDLSWGQVASDATDLREFSHFRRGLRVCGARLILRGVEREWPRPASTAYPRHRWTGLSTVAFIQARHGP